jgi:apolipoprotein N-acyltransferase
MNPITHPTSNDRLSWLWLAIGAVLLPLVQYQTVWPLAAWLAPVFLLRFARTRPAGLALPVLALVYYMAAVVALRNVMPLSMVVFLGATGLVGLPAYIVDKALSGRLPGLPRTLAFPATAVIMDWLFGKSPLGTFGSPAYSQFGNLQLTQLVALTGVAGLVFLVAWLAPVINEIWEHGLTWPAARRSLLPFGAVLAAVLVYGSARVAFFAPTAPTVRVAALTADRRLTEALDLPRLAELAAGDDALRAEARTQFEPLTADLLERTRLQARAGAKIVTWGETSLYVLQEDEPALLARAAALARAEGIYLHMGLISSLRSSRFPVAENRAVLIDPSGQVAWDYHKSVNFGGDLQNVANGPGRVPVVDTPYGRLAVVICFDADFPELVRQAGQARADILLVPAKDWIPVEVMHPRVAAFRAIENGLALVRPTETGQSIAVDGYGRVLATTDYFATDAATMVADVPTRSVRTLYVVLGDGGAYACLAGLIGLMGLALIQRRSPAGASANPALQPGQA